MLTDFAAGSSTADFMILSPGAARRRSWSDTTTLRLSNRLADFTRYRRPRISSVAVPGKNVERIKINVSGKRYELTYSRLFKFPKSLLARSARREEFYDADNDEYFFDRSRMAFESVYHFYQTAGEFFRPEHIPDNILMKEMQFFGLLQYVSLPGDVSVSVSPSNVNVPRNKYQRIVWELFENPSSSIAARLLNVVMLLVILVSITLLCIETLPKFDRRANAEIVIIWDDGLGAKLNKTNNTGEHLGNYRTKSNQILSSELQKLFIVETFCIACFTLELLIRFLVSADKRRFCWNVLNIFDFLAVLPFYVTLAISTQSLAAIQSAYVLRVLRLTRILRLAKIYRYSSAVQIFVKTVRECLNDFLLLCFLIMMTTTLFASTCYFFEQEQKGTNFVSIPAAFWWAIITMTSVGYGDMVPVTLAGKINGALCVVFGVIIITPLLPIIGSKFNSIQEKVKIENILTSEKPQISDDSDDSSESSEDCWRKTVTFAEEDETFEIPEFREDSSFESFEYSARLRSVTVI